MSASLAENAALAAPSKLFAPGDMVDGRYRIESYLGGGGMASVYRATHVVLEQPVAIKVISSVIREMPGMAQRFLREARAATQLKSEHVARVTDVGTMADGSPFMVMEYLAGHDLDALVESSEVLSVEDTVDYVLQTCEALAEVHGLGIVHRDLKPANLFLTRGADGMPCVKLIDFGISRTDSPLASKESMALTQPDTVMGSPRYMSPEQMESAAKADVRSDIYGLGAVLYELLTKKAPHEGDTFLDIYAAATLAPPAAPSAVRGGIPHALDAVILRCLRIEPEGRYLDIADLANALAPFGPEGSMGRADAISRILEAARSRTREAGTTDESTSPRAESRSSSKVRRRGPSSVHSVRRRRIARVAMLGGLLVLVAVAFGVRSLLSGSLHARAQAAGFLPVSSTAAAGTPAAATPPVLAAAPLAPAAAPQTAATAAPKVAVTTTAAEPIVRVAAVPTTTAKAEEQPRPAYRGRPAATATASSEERDLFEDRK